MKNILLIEPRPPGFHVYSSFPVPRVGLFILGAIMREKGYSASVYLQSVERIPINAMREADVVAISSTTSTANEAYHLARAARHEGKLVVMGGPHVTFVPEEALAHCDVVVRGEGEESFPLVVDALLSGAPLDGIDGISFMRDGTVVTTPARPLIEDLNALPYPDYSLASRMPRVRVAPVITSRGCPFDCTFCSVTEMFGRRYRYRSAENVAGELERYPGKAIFFADDNFTAVPSRTMELLKIMKDRGLASHGWTAQTRVEVARNKELLTAMADTGCTRVYVGFESVNPKTLERFNKKQNPDDVAECIRIMHTHGIAVHGMFILGADDDEPETLRDTAVFANRMRIDSVQFLALTPLPGTRTTDELAAQGRIITRDWQFYDGHHVVFAPKRMTPYQLHVGIQRAMLQFYNWKQAVRYAARRDVVNAAVRMIGRGILTKAIRCSRDFSVGLRRYEYKLSEWVRDGFAFDENSLASSFVRFKARQGDKVRRGVEMLRARLTVVDEMKTRAAFITLRGELDVPQARAVMRSARRRVRRGKTALVLNFENVREITPRGMNYLAARLSRLEKRCRSINLLGLPDSFRKRVEASLKYVPRFEFYDSLEAFKRGLQT